MNFNLDLSAVSENKSATQMSNFAINLESVTDDEMPASGNNASHSLKGLALDLENVAVQEEENEIINEFLIESSSIDRIIAAIGAGIAVESVINARILDKFNSISESDNAINEGRALLKTVVRKGQLTKKTVCPEGFRVVNGTCQRMTAKDAITFSRRAKKAAKTRARRKPSGASMKMRNRSILVRKRNESKVDRVIVK